MINGALLLWRFFCRLHLSVQHKSTNASPCLLRINLFPLGVREDRPLRGLPPRVSGLPRPIQDVVYLCHSDFWMIGHCCARLCGIFPPCTPTHIIISLALAFYLMRLTLQTLTRFRHALRPSPFPTLSYSSGVTTFYNITIEYDGKRANDAVQWKTAFGG